MLVKLSLESRCPRHSLIPREFMATTDPSPTIVMKHKNHKEQNRIAARILNAFQNLNRDAHDEVTDPL